MSVYPQSMYGQPSYGTGPGYPPARPPAYQHQYFQPAPPPPPPQPQPAPAPAYHSDPTTFRRDFTARLSNLTFNSRDHIQGLSMMAQDHPQFASIVSQALDHHIRQVPPWMKLPGFYLLDAIAKNVYDPYAGVFSRVVVGLFADTYYQVDGSTRNKMEEMLLTWRTAGPDHTEIFGHENQIQLQRVVWGDQMMASKAQVLAELQFTLGQMDRALQSNPSDRTPQNHIHVLNQLRRLVERGVSQKELREILDQLRSLARSALPPPITRPPPRPPVAVPAPYYAPQTPFPPQMPPASRPYSQPLPPFPPNSASTSVPQVTPAVAPSVPIIPANLENLFASLRNAGLIPGSDPSSSSLSAKVEQPVSKPEDEEDVNNATLRDYRHAILSQPMKLTTSDLAKTKPRAVEFLYDRQGSQCRQCGLRFAETKLGKKKMDDHLDMHFRQNSKVDQGRGHSRSWFVGLEDWIHDSSGGNKSLADGPSSANAKADNAKRDEELRAQYVIVPPGAEAQHVSCPICKETLKSEFLEDDEEWVWKNAVKKDAKIYHATCHAEAVASTSSLAARLKTEKPHGSRSATPDATMTGIQTGARSTPPPSQLRISGSRSPPQVSGESKFVGVKRKAEHSDSNTVNEGTGTPPFKKQALSSVPISSS